MSFKKRAHESTVDLSTYFKALKKSDSLHEYYDPDARETKSTFDLSLNFDLLEDEVELEFFQTLVGNF